MHISVVIPTHQRPQGLRELLLSLTDQDLTSLVAEIHVVGNFANDPGAQVVNEFAKSLKALHWHHVGTKGANRARNLGLQKAAGEIVLFLDDDCVLSHRYFLQEVWQAHQKHPNITAIGGPYFVSPQASDVQRAYNLTALQWLKRVTEKGSDHINLVGGNVSYKRATLIDNGFEFNSDIVFGGAETDLHVRLYQAGHRLLFLESLGVEHRAQLSGYDLLRKGFLQGIGAHQRWQRELHVPTRYLPAVHRMAIPTRQRLWLKAFEKAFHFGADYARVAGPDLVQASWLNPKYIFRLGLYKAKQWTMARVRRCAQIFSIRRPAPHQARVSLPLNRFYVLPVSRDCTHNCRYAENLGCKSMNEHEDLDTQLNKAKAYGFKQVLLPCNTLQIEHRRQIFSRIKSANLEPVLLVNGDSRTAVAPEILQEAAEQTDFHLLLSTPSSYQSSLVNFFEERKPGCTSATYLHTDKRRGLKMIRDAPKPLLNRLHFHFPARGDLWHPDISCKDIYSFLRRAQKALGRSRQLNIRSSSGFWPTPQDVENKREVWPLLQPKIISGKKSPQITFSFIIPSFDSGAHLLKILRAINGQSMTAARFEVIVVDDGSSDGTEHLLQDELLRQGPYRFFLSYFYWPRPQTTTPVFRAGLIRNLGVSHAQGEVLCFIDSDILLPPNYLTDLEERLEHNDVIQSRREMLNAEASRRAQGFEGFTAADTYLDDPYWENFKACDSWSQMHQFWKYTCTYTLAMRKDLFMKAGWFSPSFFTYGFEDVELGYRLAKMGARFHLSSNTVYHMYPERKQHNYHFDQHARTQALTLSSRVFYRERLDPAIFQEFYPAYYQPLRGELKIWRTRMSWLWKGKVSLLWGTIVVRVWYDYVRRPWMWLWHGQILYVWGTVVIPVWYRKILPTWTQVWYAHLLKPYYFLRFQWQKRLGRARAEH